MQVGPSEKEMTLNAHEDACHMLLKGKRGMFWGLTSQLQSVYPSDPGLTMCAQSPKAGHGGGSFVTLGRTAQ